MNSNRLGLSFLFCSFFIEIFFLCTRPLTRGSRVTNYALVKSKEKKKYFVSIRWFEQPLAYCTICAFE